jgi:hypothetical protein
MGMHGWPLLLMGALGALPTQGGQLTCAPCPDPTSHTTNTAVSEIITTYFMRA